MSELGLVAYDSSDSEAGEEVVKLPLPMAQPELEPQTQYSTGNSSTCVKPHPVNSMQDGVHDSLKEVQKTFVKIAIPALEQFDTDNSDGKSQNKKQLKDNKAVCLFALLPPPKAVASTSKTFIPNVLTRRTTRPKAVPQKRPPDDSDDDDTAKFDDDIWKKVCGRNPKLPRKVIKSIASTSNSQPVVNATPESLQPYNGLDNHAFKQLVGTSKLHNVNDIKLVNVNEKQVMPNRELWVARALTDPECKPKYVVEEPVDDTCKKKHHITYLAQQAKANEQDLQNQWAACRYSRKQTQAKYGF